MASALMSKTASAQADQKFTVGDIVLCRYSSYPYWPATVDLPESEHEHGQQRYKTKHFAMRRINDGEMVLCFWCYFSNEDSGAWVPADRIVLFHPDILDMIRVSKDHLLFEDQKEDIERALKAFQYIYNDEKREMPQLPSDLEKGIDAGKWGTKGDGQIHPEMNDGRKANGRPARRDASRSAGRRSEPRKKVPNIDVERGLISSRKRRQLSDAPCEERSFRTQKIEGELIAVKETVADLKEHFLRKYNALTQQTRGICGVACRISLSSPQSEEHPLRCDNCKSVPVCFNKIKPIMDSLCDSYERFTMALEAVEKARTDLETTLQTVMKVFEEASGVHCGGVCDQ